MTDILMPALSPTMEEGVLAKWIVKVGDTVHAGDIIAEIETDKATMEVEAVDDGVLTEILVPAGAEGVKVNTPIARLRAEGDPQTPSAPHAEEAQGPAKAADPAPAAAPEPDDVQISAPTPPKDAPAASEPPATRDGETASRILASPLARRIAADRGLDLSRVEGTGPHGRIVKADVADLAQDTLQETLQETLPAKKQAEAQAEAPAPRAAMTLEQMGVPPGSYDLLPLDGMRKTIARRMSESFRDVPHFPLTIDLEIDRLLDARGRLNHALSARGVKVSVNDFVIKACALALKAVPDANASYTPDGIALHHHADVAVAVAIEGGLITPIIRAAETRTLADISSAMKDLAERARSRKLKPEEFQGGTFSLSNLGMMGIKSFASIINEPQGCILSVGAGEKRPVVRDDQLAIATVMTATLTCDHRVVDGAIGARWLQTFKSLIEDPILMLA